MEGASASASATTWTAGPGEGDVEDPPLALLVVAQPVWEEPLRGIEDDHVVPFAPLDAMHGGQQHQRSVGTAVRERTSRSQVSKVVTSGVQGRHRLERGQVVGMGGAVRLAARAIEDVHGLAEPDVDPDGFERRGR